MPFDAGYSYIGTSARYFRQIHATAFVIHTPKSGLVEPLKMLRDIICTEKGIDIQSLPEPIKHVPTDDELRRIIQEFKWLVLAEEDRRITEPRAVQVLKDEIDELRKSRSDVNGMELGTAVAFVIAALQELLRRVETVERKLSASSC